MKLYVLVREDLSATQQAVQAGHAIASYLREHRDTTWDNGTLVYLGLRGLPDLHHWKARFTEAGISSSAFYEPDIDAHTAFAAVLDCADNHSHKKFKRKMDSKLKLLNLSRGEIRA